MLKRKELKDKQHIYDLLCYKRDILASSNIALIAWMTGILDDLIFYDETESNLNMITLKKRLKEHAGKIKQSLDKFSNKEYISFDQLDDCMASWSVNLDKIGFDCLITLMAKRGCLLELHLKSLLDMLNDRQISDQTAKVLEIILAAEIPVDFGMDKLLNLTDFVHFLSKSKVFLRTEQLTSIIGEFEGEGKMIDMHKLRCELLSMKQLGKTDGVENRSKERLLELFQGKASFLSIDELKDIHSNVRIVEKEGKLHECLSYAMLRKVLIEKEVIGVKSDYLESNKGDIMLDAELVAFDALSELLGLE